MKCFLCLIVRLFSFLFFFELLIELSSNYVKFFSRPFFLMYWEFVTFRYMERLAVFIMESNQFE